MPSPIPNRATNKMQLHGLCRALSRQISPQGCASSFKGDWHNVVGVSAAPHGSTIGGPRQGSGQRISGAENTLGLGSSGWLEKTRDTGRGDEASS